MRWCPHTFGPVSGRIGRALVGFCLAVLCAALPVLAQEGAGADGRPVVVGINRQFPPYEYLNAKGEPEGYCVDVVKAVAKAMGFRVRFQAAGVEQLRQDLRDHRIDVMASLLRTEERQRYADFSKPLIQIHYSIFIRKGEQAHEGVESLRGHRILVEHGSMIHEHLEKLGFGTELRPVGSGPDALRLLAAGEGDAALVTHLQGLTLIRASGLGNLRLVGEPVLTRELCMATGKGEGELLGRLDTGLAILHRTGESGKIYQSWFGGLGTEGPTVKRVLLVSALALGAVLVLLFGILLWNRSLRRQVRERTRALSETLRDLRRSEGNLAEAQQLAGVGSLEVDPVSRETYWSGQLYRLLGQDPGLGTPPLEVLLKQVQAEDRLRVRAAAMQVFESGVPAEVEHRVLLEDGSERLLLTRLKRLSGEDGRPPRLIATCQDITERRREEEALRQTQRLESLGVLAGGIAHDFNNLLAGIQGNLNLAQAHIGGDHPAHRHLATSEDTVQRAANLAKQMLAYSGRGAFLIRPLQFNELIREMTELLRVTLSKHVDIRFQLDPDLPLIEGDESQLQQVVMNLVTNAAEAIGDRAGLISISTRVEHMEAGALNGLAPGFQVAEGAYAVLEVRDTGCGMDSATLGRIFDPFFTTKFSGRGLGLSALQGILRGHRGACAIHSAPGEGTLFTVYLPACSAGSTLLQAQERPPASVLPPRVLLAEDDPTVREATRELLEGRGCSVIEAADGLEAVEIFRARADEIPVVILDLTMPRMGGKEAMKAIRSIRPGIPVIITSGHHEQEVHSGMDDGEIFGFLPKPYRFQDLENLLARAEAAPEFR